MPARSAARGRRRKRLRRPRAIDRLAQDAKARLGQRLGQAGADLGAAKMQDRAVRRPAGGDDQPRQARGVAVRDSRPAWSRRARAAAALASPTANTGRCRAAPSAGAALALVTAIAWTPSELERHGQRLDRQQRLDHHVVAARLEHARERLRLGDRTGDQDAQRASPGRQLSRRTRARRARAAPGRPRGRAARHRRPAPCARLPCAWLPSGRAIRPRSRMRAVRLDHGIAGDRGVAGAVQDVPASRARRRRTGWSAA